MCGTIRDREGGSEDNIDETISGWAYTVGTPADVVRAWYICAKDCAAGNVGYIDYASLRVHWSIPTVDMMQLSKTLVDPAGSSARVGDRVQYNIDIENSGPIAGTISTLPLVDEFDGGCLSYVEANPPPDNADLITHRLLWYDLGPLLPDERRTI
jgi:hypothetical protein